MQKSLSNFLRYILVGVNLKFRTILSRLNLYPIFNKKSIRSKFYNPVKLNFTNNSIVEFYYKSDVVINNESVSVLNNEFDIDFFLNDNELNKDDYLHYYTFFYLNWDNLDFELSKNNNWIIDKISNSKISNQPFVISQQAFNLFVKVKDTTKYNFLLKSHYQNLRNSIEYKVDGNHVLENLISIILLEFYFFQNSKSVFKLLKEIQRQNRFDMHVERNVKYSIDMCRKIRIVLSVDYFNSNKYKFIKEEILEIINKWDYNSFCLKKSIPIVHDNIDGDELGISYYKENLFLESNKSQEKYFYLRPINGFRGHSFDVNIMPNFKGSIFFGFGTITYANNFKRCFQRLRYNNIQPCLSKNDRSMFFWKSFRHLLTLPAMVFKSYNTIYITELIYSNSCFKKLSYKYLFFNEGFELISKKSIIMCLRCDQISYFSENKIQIGNNEFIAISGKFKLSNSLRALGINVYKSCYKIEFEGVHYKYYSIKN